MSVELNDLDLNVDIAVAGPDDYIDSNVSVPLPIGTYSLRLLDWGTEPAKQSGKPPVIVLKQVEVAEGAQEGKRLSFQRVYATPFDRKNPITGETERASGLADLIRSIDKSFDTKNMNMGDVKAFLDRAVDDRTTFKAKVDREGFDTDYFKSQAELQGIPKGDYKSPAAKTLNAACTLKGKKFFAESAVATNPVSGNKVEARNRITNFFVARG
jgi:hypothetical protein